LSSNSNESAPKNGNANVNGNGNYRFDEMVLDTGKPMNMQQIIVPSMKVDKRYVTDEGFVVPCIDLQLRQMIFEQSYKQGFNKQRQIECMGRSCAEMALQLVGGPLRFSKKNNHQKPTVLVLANSQHVQGVYALCTARLLSIRNVKIYLFVYNSKSEPSKKKQDDEEEIETFFKSELNLFCSTDEANFKLLNDVDDVKTLQSVDLILNGLESPDTASVVQIESQLIKYIDQYKASVVSIDPPVNGSILQSKWCITPVLPMAMSANCGRVYLCDLGFTKNMFQSVNIKYQSPFGAKFLIPLHND
jgi:enhancer of mRNA-decapping protein 3